MTLALPHPVLLSLAIALAPAGDEADPDPDYPLGKLRPPPMIEPATPFRLVDLRYRHDDAGDVASSFEARMRVGASSFLGGELTDDRRSIFHDTTRTELGLTERGGDYVLEGALRLRRFSTRSRIGKRPRGWRLGFEGGFRVNPELELFAAFDEELTDTVFDEEDPLESFVETGRLPTGRPATRELRTRALGLLYQRGSRLDVSSRVERSRLRAEAGFDFDRTRLGIETIWNLAPLELSADAGYEQREDRLARKVSDVAIDAEVRLTSRLVARAGTRQRWEPGTLRFQETYRAGATLFARRHRFAREAEAARRVEELTARAFDLGYNERRVYDLEGLRALRERLGISRQREELAPLIEALYRAQVAERNVPLLGFELVTSDDKRLGVETRLIEILAAIPWRLGENPVEFLTLTFRHREDNFSDIVRSVSRSLTATLELNRELRFQIAWARPGSTPLDIAFERDPETRVTFAIDYALGR